MTVSAACPGCGLRAGGAALVDAPGGPASAHCHGLFGDLLARSYEGSPRVRSVHQLVVDAYVAQHPGGTGRRQVQAVALCLMTLQLFVEVGVDPTRGSALHAVMADHPADFALLEPPAAPAAVTVADVLTGPRTGCTDADPADADRADADHAERVWSWGAAVWASWSAHHDTVRDWNRQCLTGRVRLP